jgi:putative ABC transport system ATP-binding protein
MSGGTRETKITGGAWILEQFTLGNPVHERNAARRVLSEVMRAWPGNVDRLWWKWFNEAAISLGLRSKTIDCTVEEAVSLAQDGAQIVIYSEDPEPEWLAVLGTANRKFQTVAASESVRRRMVSIRGLRRMLTRAAVDGRLRCAVVQPLNVGGLRNGGKTSLPPFERLRQLLQPEWSDIWIVFVFSLVAGILALATPIAVEALVNTVAFGRFVQPIVVLAFILFTFLGFRSALRGLQTYVVEIIQRRLFARVAADLAHRLPRTEIEATDECYMPELVNRFFDIVTVQKVSAQLLLDGILLIMGTTIGMAVLGFYHPWLLGFDLLLLSAIAIIIFVLGRGAVPTAIKESKNKYTMAAWLEDIARCPTTFRNDGGREFAMERADRLIHEYLYARKTHFRILMRQILFALGLQAVASTVLLGLGGWLVVSGELTLGQLVAAELIVTTIVGAFAKIGKHMESFYDLLAAVDKLGALIDLPTEREDGVLSIERDGPIEVELNAVTYSWPGKPTTLDGVSATIPAGASLAIVGSSGCGKSTLLDLIYGVRVPTAGHVTIDGFDPRDLRPDVLRKHVALVRGTEVFHATVEENVHLHREDITAANVRDILHGIGLLDAIPGLEAGSNTMLTSGGSPLTENQLRLLSIARAAVGGPGLLLIDGVLDGLSDDDLERTMEFLLRPDQPWTLIISTGRDAIASRCGNRFELASAQPSHS